MDARKFAYFSIYFGIAVGLAALLLYLFKTTPLNADQSIAHDIFSSYGSLVGGVVGPFFALAGVLLLITSLAESKKAFLKQQIENRFFQLVEIHRENSNQIQIKNRSGKKIFITLLRELYESYRIALSACKTHSIESGQAPNIAYLAFFYGAAGETSKSILTNRLRNRYSESFINELFLLYENRRNDIDKEDFAYEIFDGHQSRLGHYYRHLFQTVSYINDQPSDTLSYREKYQYVKTLRAQLSTQEQLLFFWNSISDIGLAWEKDKSIVLEDRKLITKYNLVKNVPEGYSKYISTRDYYPIVEYEGLSRKPEGRDALENSYC
ncbi:MAG: putative phage abortive infection protein [Candidatus Thiodiazotropha endolucinida]